MNVYDFDGTVYDGDSSIDFYFFCLKKKPTILIRCIVIQLYGAVLYWLKKVSKEQFKECFFSFLRCISADEKLLNAFWDQRSGRIKSWYLNQKKESDVFISASPEFLLKPICDRLGVSLIASKVDPSTGTFIGRNCHGAEKIVRFRERYPDAVIDNFYTDSQVDLPLAKIARHAFLVKHNTVCAFQIEDEL